MKYLCVTFVLDGEMDLPEVRDELVDLYEPESRWSELRMLITATMCSILQ